MRKLSMALIAIFAALGANAQFYVPDADNPEMLHYTKRATRQRKEFVLPVVNGYNVYKADLHTHTIYSDGNVTPEFRVQEAWYSGLDVLAITDHIEYRPCEGAMLNFLKGYITEGTTAANLYVTDGAADERGILSDMNYPVKLAQSAATGYDITIIPGIEITRTPEAIGHYNALFTKDNNAIYTADALQSLRNAKAQGAIIMLNHQGWRRKNLDLIEFEKKAYAEGLIDGIEIMNGTEFYPRTITYAMKEGLFFASNTDIGDSIAEEYTMLGVQRNMTLIFAKDKSLASLREAIEARRTLAYACNTLAGDEQLLKDLFMASISVTTVQQLEDGGRTVAVTNNSSVPYLLRMGHAEPVELEPFKFFMVTIAKDGFVEFTIENMWCGEDKHPVIELK